MGVESESINYIEPHEFWAEGFLQEANRLFFHPLGLALECDPEKEAGEYAIRVWDYRGDPEGIAFADPPDEGKAERVHAEEERHAQPRLEKWGWFIQPIGEGLER